LYKLCHRIMPLVKCSICTPTQTVVFKIFHFKFTFELRTNLRNDIDQANEVHCCTPLYEECLKYHGHKGDPRMTPETCSAGGERAQVSIVWVRTPSVGNASQLQKLGVIRVRPSVMRRLWREDSRMLKKILIGGVS
jgi:hypothetical protein